VPSKAFNLITACFNNRYFKIRYKVLNHVRNGA
jgi:hypothetical protein